MENDPFGPEIPKIESEVMRSESESKAGFLPVLLSKLGLGGAGGAAAGVGSGIIASKAGIVALIVAGSSVAAGGLWKAARSRWGTKGGNCQSCPFTLNWSGGAPTVAPLVSSEPIVNSSASIAAHYTAPHRKTP